jgi:hypothetical protein
MGLHVVSGELRIAAFANNTPFDLVTLGGSGPALTSVHQVGQALSLGLGRSVNRNSNRTLAATPLTSSTYDISLGKPDRGGNRRPARRQRCPEESLGRSLTGVQK